MRAFLTILLLATAAVAQTSSPELPLDDAIRIKEFYRLATQIQDQVWPNWSQVPAPLLIVTRDAEFLTHHPSPPKDFKPVGNGFYARRRRQFATNLQATFPAFGPPSVIVIGQPRNTMSKASTPWLITVMHEHFHQLQNAQPGYFQAVEDLGLSRGDTTGMWMLNYSFPYHKPEVVRSFANLRDVLLNAVNESDKGKAKKLAQQYIRERKRFFAQLSPNDRKYLNFQLWQEESPATHRSRAPKQPLTINLLRNTRRLRISNHSRPMPPRPSPKLLTNSSRRTSPNGSARLFIRSARLKACCSTESIRSGRTDILSICCQWIRSSRSDSISGANAKPAGPLQGLAGMFTRAKRQKLTALRSIPSCHRAYDAVPSLGLPDREKQTLRGREIRLLSPLLPKSKACMRPNRSFWSRESQ